MLILEFENVTDLKKKKKKNPLHAFLLNFKKTLLNSWSSGHHY